MAGEGKEVADADRAVGAADGMVAAAVIMVA